MQLDGKQMETAKSVLADIGLSAVNVAAWLATLSQALNILQQLGLLVGTALSIYLLILRIKKFKKNKGGNDDGNNLFIG